MKSAFITGLILAYHSALGQTLPVITSSPANQTVYPGNTAAFTVAATGATSYQWLFNGTNIPGATSATLQVVNAQSTNCGYYLAMANNATGWTPSQMAYLTLDYTYGGSQPTACGILPLSNSNNMYFAGDVNIDTLFGSQPYPTNGTVQIVAGPELDQMQPVGQLVHYQVPGSSTWFYDGYYKAPRQFDALTAPGQTIYYGVLVNFTNLGYHYVFPSTIMSMVAGTNGSVAPSCYGLKFPGWFISEGVEPIVYPQQPTNQLRVLGETCSFTNTYFAYTDYGIPTAQWRKNGVVIATNNVFMENIVNGFDAGYGYGVVNLTNVQASDAGIYDMIIYGNEWEVSPKIILSVQTTNGQGIFQNPNFSGTNFVCDLAGAAGRNYTVQWSTNLTTWSNLTTLSNTTGTVAFTNSVPTFSSKFYRTVLLP